jgi:uncharacterized protein (DUF58 family)
MHARPWPRACWLRYRSTEDHAVLATWRESLYQRALRFWERRLPALTRLKAAERLPVELHRRRIYVLPTGFGLFFGVLLLAMIVGGLNYNNNPALLLAFLLVSAAHTALLQGFLDLRGLRLTDAHAEPVHAGQEARLRLRFERGDGRIRRGIVVRRDASARTLDLEAGSAEVALNLPTERRGLLPVGRLLVETRQPLGLVRAWSWLHPERSLLVYPALEAHGPPLPMADIRRGARLRRGPGEQLHSLRDYRSGDPLRLVAWKRSAQAGHLLVREFEQPAGGDALLDWEALGGLDPESRIRRLARWVVEAERGGVRSTLAIPGARIGPGRGAAHVHACLRALALLPQHG